MESDQVPGGIASQEPLNESQQRVGVQELRHCLVCGQQKNSNQIRADYKLLFDSNHLAIASTDSQFRFVEVNQAFLDLLGYSQEQICGGMTLADIAPIEADTSHSIELINKLYAREIESFEIEKRYQCANGETIEAITSVTATFDPEAKLIGCTAIILDITKRRQIEKQLREALVKVETAKKELVRSEKLASLGSLVAGIAHEINTPLGSSLTIASTIQTNLTHFLVHSRALENGDEQLLRMVNRLEKGMNLILKNLLEAANLISNFKNLAVDRTSGMRRKFKLSKLLEENLATIQHICGNKVAFCVNVDPDIECDSYPGELGRVVSNILKNAVIHAFPGEIAGKVDIFGELSADDPAMIRLTIRDNGKGMSAKTIEHAFDPFYTTQMGKGGSGLGLYIAYSLINKVLRGTIALNSQINQGTEFNICFPIDAGDSEEQACRE